jgi:hypothetical protein
MNLVAYDKVSSAPTKSKIHTYSGFPYIITREVNYRKYYCFVTRYEPTINDTILYLVLLDDNPPDRAVAKTRRDNYGRLKFNMSILAGKFNIPQSKQVIINLSLETQADDGDIYKLELESD